MSQGPTPNRPQVKVNREIVRFYRCKLCLDFLESLDKLVTHWVIGHGINVVGPPTIVPYKQSISGREGLKREVKIRVGKDNINRSSSGVSQVNLSEGGSSSGSEFEIESDFSELSIKSESSEEGGDKKETERPFGRKMNINVNNTAFELNLTSTSGWVPEASLYLPIQAQILEPQVTTVESESTFGCPVCNVQFQTRSQLMGHTRKHMKDKLFQCKLCEQNFPTHKELKSHLGDKTETQVDDFSITCGICSRAFPTQACLSHHLNCHKQAGSAPVIIDNPSAERRYSCSLCSKTFKNSQHVQRHLRIHTGEKPFSCDLCGQSFSLNHNLQRHMRTHTGEKPHKCPVCAKEFAEGHNLKRHMISAHDGPTPYICTICNRKFAENSILRKHQSRAHKQQNQQNQQQQNTSQ